MRGLIQQTGESQSSQRQHKPASNTTNGWEQFVTMLGKPDQRMPRSNKRSNVSKTPYLSKPKLGSILNTSTESLEKKHLNTKQIYGR